MQSNPIISCHFTYNLSYYGGGHRQLQILADYNDPKKSQIILASLSRIDGFETTLNQSVTIHEFNMERKHLFYQINRLKNFIRCHNVHIIHAYGTRCQFLAFVVGKLLKIPVVAWEIGLLKHDGIKGQCIDSIVEFCVDERCCNSEATLRARQASLFYVRCRWSVLYLGTNDQWCNIGEFRSEQRHHIRKKLNLQNDDIIIATIGGLIPLRDHATIIRAIAKLRETRIPVKAIFIGNGPLYNDLKKLSQEERIEEHIIFLGYINKAVEYLPAIDIYINNADKEGFGFATVEAMLAGVPVIAANAGANSEVIEHNKTGLLIEPKNVTALANTIRMLLENEELRFCLSKTARNIALDRFSPEKFAQGHLQLCYRVLSKRKR